MRTKLRDTEIAYYGLIVLVYLAAMGLGVGLYFLLLAAS